MTFLLIALFVMLGEVVFAFALSALRRLGSAGARLHDALCHAPLLDAIVFLQTVAPGIVGAAIDGWRGLGAAILGQIAGLVVWVFLHERVHREAARGPRLVKAQNNALGWFRNHLGLWVSTLAVPVFWAIRFGEYIVYPPLCWIIGFPKYRQREWVSVGRHKFEGLVGHDLIWCLYCDWMTGVYSLGGEMLRNIESFWCPIRFYDGKKCENCRIDFPDVDVWAVPDGSVAPAVELWEQQYGNARREWFGHPARLTVGGAPVDTGSRAAQPDSE